jgi:uncharacterized Zn-binding protein involved in type VI secretion
MLGIVRAGIDKNVGHASPCPNPFHQGVYKAGLNSKVFVEGKLAIVKGDSMNGCDDTAVGGSAKVFVQGYGVHRRTDATSGHDLGGCPGPFPANLALSGSGKVFAG